MQCAFLVFVDGLGRTWPNLTGRPPLVTTPGPAGCAPAGRLLLLAQKIFSRS
jgi:hypothetical protein